MTDIDLFVIPAEVRRDVYNGNSNNPADRHDQQYAPTTLVMTFPPGELDQLRRLIKEISQ